MVRAANHYKITSYYMEYKVGNIHLILSEGNWMKAIVGNSSASNCWIGNLKVGNLNVVKAAIGKLLQARAIAQYSISRIRTRALPKNNVAT